MSAVQTAIGQPRNVTGLPAGKQVRSTTSSSPTGTEWAGRVIRRLTERDFQRMVESMVRLADPAAIILFGSYARGDVHQYSDVDLLVLRRRRFEAGESRRKELGQLYRSVTDVCDAPKDIILFTLDEFYSWRETTNHMVAVAWNEGRILYGQV